VDCQSQRRAHQHSDDRTQNDDRSDAEPEHILTRASGCHVLVQQSGSHVHQQMAVKLSATPSITSP
jgi:hypothetical protein